MVVSDVLIEHASPNLVVGLWQNAVIQIFYGPITVAGLKRTDIVHRRVAASFEQTLSFSVTASQFHLPDAEARRVASQLIESRGTRLLVSAIVIEGGGMWATAARSAVTGMFLLGGGLKRNRSFSNIDEAANWSAPLVKPALDAAALAKAVQTVRTYDRANERP